MKIMKFIINGGVANGESVILGVSSKKRKYGMAASGNGGVRSDIKAALAASIGGMASNSSVAKMAKRNGGGNLRKRPAARNGVIWRRNHQCHVAAKYGVSAAAALRRNK